MVPLYVHLGQECKLDQVELTPDALYGWMRAHKELPKSSQPSPADFLRVYDNLAAQGYEQAVSFHLSGALSGTLQSAEVAAAQAAIPVHTVDTRCVTTSLGLMADAAVAARAAGMQAAEIADHLRNIAPEARLMGLPDSLENLVKGGRATAAQGFATSLLNIKLLLELKDGKVVPLAKVRGTKAAISKMTDLLDARCQEAGPLRARILHTCNLPAVDALRESIDAVGLPVAIESVDLCGAVIGTHVGEGAIGICTLPESCIPG